MFELYMDNFKNFKDMYYMPTPLSPGAHESLCKVSTSYVVMVSMVTEKLSWSPRRAFGPGVNRMTVLYERG